MPCLKLPAYGKINLSLDILGVRDDGFHQLSTIMQSIKLADWLTFKADDSGEIRLRTQGTKLPTDQNNLIVKAAKLLQTKFSPKKGVDIYLEKHLPIGAGLGGGSSDGAVTLKALNILWDLNLTTSRLVSIGAQIGADIPFTLLGGTALAEGIGEKLTILKPLPKIHLILVKPAISLGAGEVYQNWDKMNFTSNHSSPKVLQALANKDYHLLARNAGNDLERVVKKLAPETGEIISELERAGVVKAMVSGSGPTVIGFLKNKEQGLALAKKFSKKYKEVYLTETI